MANRWGKNGNDGRFYFPGLPNHCSSDACPLGKAMTNLDSILKSRDITWLTKLCIVKTMVFLEVMYGCESWTMKNAEHPRIDFLNCGIGEDP